MPGDGIRLKLIVLSGPSGSGKSTRARELAEENHRLRYVSYDGIREACGDIEPAEITRRLIRKAGRILCSGASVLVDAVNLHPHDALRWETVALAMGAELEWVSMETPIEVCIERDSLRADPVGRERILEQVKVAA